MHSFTNTVLKFHLVESSIHYCTLEAILYLQLEIGNKQAKIIFSYTIWQQKD